MVKQTLLIVLCLHCGFAMAQEQSLGDPARALREERRKMLEQNLARHGSKGNIPTAPTSDGPAVATALSDASPRGPCESEVNLRNPEILAPYLAPYDAASNNTKSCAAGQQEFKTTRQKNASAGVQPRVLEDDVSFPQVEEARRVQRVESQAVQEVDAAVDGGGSEEIAALGAAPGTMAPGNSTAGGTSPGPASPPPWIWQGSDNTPVRAGGVNPRQRRLIFNPLSESGFILKLNGNAHMGYSFQSQNASPTFTDFNGGGSLNASGVIYNPQLVSYRLWGAYDRRDAGYGNLGGGGNSFDYGATVSFLQATPAPFSVSFMRDSDKYNGTLTVPFRFDSQSLAVDGLIHKLPVQVSYHLGDGDTSTITVDGHDFNYRYTNGDVVISKKFRGFDFHLTDDYLHSHSKQTLSETTKGNGFAYIADVGQTINNLRWNVERNFGSRITMHVDGNVSKYNFDETNLQSTDSTLTSFGGGLLWSITNKLTTSFSGLISHNAVNILQLLSLNTGVPLPNPLPGVSVLNSSSRLFSSMASYRPSRHWTFGAATSYNSAGFPALSAASVPTREQGLTNRILSNDLSAAYNHHVWKFDYFGTVSGGLENYLYTSGQGGLAKIYDLSTGITGGDERTLRYGARFTIDRTDNPVFFSLLNSRDRIYDVDLARRARFVRLDGRVSYSQREIEYSGSTQHLNALNFMLAANLSTVNVTASHYTSDTNQGFFAILSPVGGGAGITPLPPGLLAPVVFARTKSDAVAASWRARRNLQLDSRYTRYGFMIIGTNQMDQETWFDNSIQYHLGRFDIIGGFIHATGKVPAFDRRMNRIYFRIRFPFQIW